MKTKYAESSPGNQSSTRLIYIIGYFWLFAISTWLIYLKAFQKLEITWVELSMLFGTIAGILSGAKLFQNGQENAAKPVNPVSWIVNDTPNPAQP